jgi:hypothetical protein
MSQHWKLELSPDGLSWFLILLAPFFYSAHFNSPTKMTSSSSLGWRFRYQNTVSELLITSTVSSATILMACGVVVSFVCLLQSSTEHGKNSYSNIFYVDLTFSPLQLLLVFFFLNVKFLCSKYIFDGFGRFVEIITLKSTNTEKLRMLISASKGTYNMLVWVVYVSWLLRLRVCLDLWKGVKKVL